MASALQHSTAMRTLCTFLSVLAAIVLVLQFAPCAVHACTALIADASAYLEWIIEGQHMDGNLTMLAEGPINP